MLHNLEDIAIYKLMKTKFLLHFLFEQTIQILEKKSYLEFNI